jgi:hypothetical protein
MTPAMIRAKTKASGSNAWDPILVAIFAILVTGFGGMAFIIGMIIASVF